jgi:2-phospho-L-lactate transferase/gluconeogenesis factor (CofD/UPF0052 family)
VEANAHLAVRLESGKVLVGQHRFTGKGQQGVDSPIADIWLTASEDSAEALADVAISGRTAKLVREAGAICYPGGSFYSSVVANLLPSGVGRAVAANRGRKIFVPNLGNDPELAGHDLRAQVEQLLRPLKKDAPHARPADFISHVLLDEQSGYAGGVPQDWLSGQGIHILRARLVPEGKGPLAEARLLCAALLRACAGSRP